MAILKLTIDDFARLFGTTVDDIPPDSRKIIEAEDFRYTKLDPIERDRVLIGILKRIDSGDMWVSGPDKKGIWERGWSENLDEYGKLGNLSALTPKFVQREPILRLERDYVRSLDPNFEFNFVDVFRRWVFREYFQDKRAIYDFGCGSCQHFPALVELFPEKELHGLDWTTASAKIIDKLVEDNNWNITSHIFDLYSPDEGLALSGDCGVFTIGTLEQIGRKYEPFLQFLLRKRPAVVMHVETFGELYDDSYLTDYLAVKYDRKRNYLEGYLDRLRQLESEGRIQILRAQRILFGSMYHDGYSPVVWKPT